MAGIFAVEKNKHTQNKNRNNGRDQCEDCVLILEKDLRILNDTFLKEVTGDVAQLLEYLPRMHEAVNSTPASHKWTCGAYPSSSVGRDLRIN